MVMRSAISRLAVLAALLVVGDSALARSSFSGGTVSDLNQLRYGADAYLADYGMFPTTDAASTWGQKLVTGRYISDYKGWKTQGSNPPDRWGRPMSMHFDPASNSVFFRSVGDNGIDDGGLLDDISSNTGVNPGYYWKSGWPTVRPIAVGVALLICALSVTGVLRRQCFVPMFFCVIPIVVGASALLISSLLVPNARSAYQHAEQPWARPIYLCGLVSWVIGVVGNGWTVVSWTLRQHRRQRLPANLRCESCGYELTGLPTLRCPECGESPRVDTSTVDALAEVVFIVQPDSEGGYSASAIGPSIHTQAESLSALVEHARDAVACHFADALERPKRIRLIHGDEQTVVDVK